MSIEPPFLLPLLEDYRYRETKVFVSALGGIPVNALFAEKLFETIAERITQSAWFLFPTHSPDKIHYLEMVQNGANLNFKFKLIIVKQINDTKDLSAYLFDGVPLNECLKAKSQDLYPLDLCNISAKEISKAKKSYNKRLKTNTPEQFNKVFNQIELHPAFSDENAKRKVSKLFEQDAELKFVIWSKSQKKPESNIKTYRITSRPNDLHDTKSFRFKLYPSGLLKDSKKHLYGFFASSKFPSESLLYNYENRLICNAKTPLTFT